MIVLPEEALALTEIHASLRRSETLPALHYRVLHAIHPLVPHDQAVLLEWRRGKARMVAASNIAAPDRKAPQVILLERLATALLGAGLDAQPLDLSSATLPKEVEKLWRELETPPLLWVSLPLPEGGWQGGMFLMRLAAPWSARDLAILALHAEVAAEAWRGWPCRKRPIGPGWRHVAIIVGLLVASLALPVTQSALAPVRIVARQPEVVTAPIDGVIRAVRVQPGLQVQPGTLLFTLDETELRGQHQVAMEEWRVARAEYDQDAQKSVRDPESSARLALLSAKEQLQRIRAEYAKQRLEQVEVTARRAGVVVLDDVDGLIGKPMKTGEKIMEIADPEQVEARILLPVADAIVLTTGGEVTLFLDAAPLDPVQARIRQINYEAEKSPQGHLVFRVVADLPNGATLQLGWSGTAKLHGQRVALAFQLLRRPLTALRQYLGW
ncbi:MAG: HlyD family efflux transporter periplasmic adaptor subunit [Magnetococcales bacterium]|nr:HlyD family efflux transporter periplasmic adaptor subunit [Magnetococcales bacterium]